MFSGCKPIGHREFLSLKLETGVPVFPEDFMNTSLGEKVALEKAHIEISEYCKKPSSKRTNYQRLNFSTPFMPVLDHSQEYIHVRVFSLARGIV